MKIRHRIYEGFEKFTTDKEKRAYAEKIIREYTKKLDSGWRPFENDIEIEYNDTLAYHFSSTFSGKTKKISPIRILFSEYLEWCRIGSASLGFKTLVVFVF